MSKRARLLDVTVPQKKSLKKKQDEQDLQFVLEAFDKSWNYAQSNYHTRWENAWKLYNNKRVKVGYTGVTNTFVPMTFSTIETMVAALAGGKPSFDFIPPFEKADQDTEILNALLDHFWDKDQWNIKIINWIRSTLIYGTGVMYMMWDIDHVVALNVPLRDFIINPAYTGLENIGPDFYCGRRYLTTKDELETFEVLDTDENSKTFGELIKKYKNLDKIQGKKSGDETDKEKKEMFYGSTVNDPENSQVEVLEIWTQDKVYSVANREIVIQCEDNPYKVTAQETDENAKGLIPFIVQRNYTDESLFYGAGEVEKIADAQELLNDITNQNTDAITFTLNPMYTLDPKYGDLIEEIENLPGAVYPVEANALQPIKMGNVPSDAFNERQNLKNEIRETTASTEVTKGVTDENSATATEIRATVAQAGQRFGIKITQIENEGFHRLARIVFEMVRLYVDSPMMVRITGKSGTRWEAFDPAEFGGNYEPRVQLQSTVEANKNLETQKAMDMYAALMQDPEINQTELKKMVLPKIFDLDPDEIELLIQQPEMQPGEGMTDPSVPQEGTTDPGVDPMAQPVTPEMQAQLDELSPEELLEVENMISPQEAIL